MKTSVLIAGISGSVFILCMIACSKANVESLTGQNGQPAVCDTAGMKYSVDVLPILENNCYGCHGNGNTGGSGGINLDGYNNLQPWTVGGLNSILYGNIAHLPGFNPMPEGGSKLDQCDIDKIGDWLNQGAPNN
jgi:hypothetical protein